MSKPNAVETDLAAHLERTDPVAAELFKKYRTETALLLTDLCARLVRRTAQLSSLCKDNHSAAPTERN